MSFMRKHTCGEITCAAGTVRRAAGANGVLDPGESVTVSLGLKNVGGPGTICTTSALTGTLQATGGVTVPSGPQVYGTICAPADPAVFRNFTFTVNPALPCGGTVTASLDVHGLEELRSGVDVITFSSPSAVGNFIQLVRENGLDPFNLPGRPLLACIGPATRKAAAEAGLGNLVTAGKYTTDGLVELLGDLVHS